MLTNSQWPLITSLEEFRILPLGAQSIRQLEPIQVQQDRTMSDTIIDSIKVHKRMTLSMGNLVKFSRIECKSRIYQELLKMDDEDNFLIAFLIDFLSKKQTSSFFSLSHMLFFFTCMPFFS